MFNFGKPSKKKFAQLVIDRIAQTYGKQFHLNPEKFELAGVDTELRMNLTNIYAEYCSVDKAERDNYLNSACSIVGVHDMELPEDWDEAKSHVMPKVWARVTMEVMDLQARAKGEKGLDAPLIPLGEHLYMTVVYDLPHSIRSLSSEDLEKWGVTIYEAMEVAKENLSQVQGAWAKAGDAFARPMVEDNYDSARVLLTDFINGLELDGTPIAIVACRDSLLLAGSDAPGAVEIIFNMAREDIEKLPRPLSPLPLILRDGEWVDWEVPANHAVREVFDELEVGYWADAYEMQKELLDSMQETDPTLPFIATYMGFQQEDPKLTSSTCAWSKGVDTLLPKTASINFVTEQGVVAKGDWGHVESIVGDLMQRDEAYYPPRYRVSEFPSDEQLDQIGRVD